MASVASLAQKLGSWMLQNYSDANSCEDRRQKRFHIILRRMPRSFGSFFQIWDMDSWLEGCKIRVISDLFFKFFWMTRKEDSRLIGF